MRNRPYIIRNYRPEDFDSLVRLASRAVDSEEGLHSVSAHDVIEALGRPRHFPEHDLFIAERARDVVGYINVTAELGIGRVVLSYLIGQGRGGEVVAVKLIDPAIRRGRELKAERAHVNVPEGSMSGQRLLAGMGFRSVRRFLELGLDLSQAHVPDLGRISPRCRHLKRGEEHKLVEIQNRSFTDTWGFNPNTLDDIAYRIGLPDCAPEDVIVACEAGSVIGYCWTRAYVGENQPPGGDKGRIYMLGVDPDYRGKGIGKEVLLAGLSYLKRKGVGVVELTVDSQNEAARALYRSAGFQIRARSLWYEKALQ